MTIKKPLSRTETTGNRRLAAIEITGLFGLYRHYIPLKPSRITILHGPNGVGKTSLLRLVDSLFDARDEENGFTPFKTLAATPFDTLTLHLVDGTFVAARQRRETIEGGRERTVLSFACGSNTTGVEQTLDLVPTSPRMPPSRLVLGRERIDLAENIKPVCAMLKERLNEGRTYYIPAERLHSNTTVESQDEYGNVNEEMQQVSSANHCAEVLKNRIRSISLISSRRGQELDRTYPLRLLGSIPTDEENRLDEDSLRRRLDSLSMKRKSLASAGLLESTEEKSTIDAIPDDPSLRRALTLYVQDSEKKLAAYNTLEKRISAFLEILRGRFLNKRLVIDMREGFYLEMDSGTKLKPEQLSSGEQHQIVLFFELLFSMEPTVLTMMDEPELSLHVEWQQQFLQDLERVVEVRPMDIIIATHSPLIVSEHWDWMVELHGRRSEGNMSIIQEASDPIDEDDPDLAGADRI